MPVTAPADRRFRRAHVKPSRRRSAARSWRWRVAAMGMAAVLVLYGGHRAVVIVKALNIFEVRRVQVRGNHRLSSGEVLGLLQDLRGRSIFDVDLDEWRRALLNSPCVS